MFANRKDAMMNAEYRFSFGNKSYYVSDLLPIICGLATFKYIYNYYAFAIPPLSGVCSMLYQVITLFFFIMFFPTVCFVLRRLYVPLWPAVVIPVLVLANIIYVVFTTGDISIISRSYVMGAAAGTNDANGFYFSQINTWFCNMTVVLLLGTYIKNKETIIKCISSTLVVLIIPILLIIAMHPSYLGTRESYYENGAVFGGGLWNIGVIGFGSICWLALALFSDFTKNQKRIVVFSLVLFVFVGAAGISRTLILMVSFSAITFFMLTKKDMSWIGKMALVALMIGLFCVLEPEFLLSIMSRFTDRTSGTNNIRIQLWQAYLSHFKEYWLIGAPEGSVYNYYRDVNLFGEYFLPHSAIINFFCRYGIMAVFGYFVLIRNSFFAIQKYSWVSRNSRICVLCGGIAYVTLAFINQTGYAEIVFYIMFGLYIAYEKISRKGI